MEEEAQKIANISRAKMTEPSVLGCCPMKEVRFRDGLVNSGFLSSRGGKVRLLKRDELAGDWGPKQATRLTVWEVMQYMIHALDKRGDVGAGDILRTVGEKGEIARDLAYRLYTVCERKGWASEALAYNSLVTSWSEISRLARREASDNNLWEATFLG